MRSVIIIAMFGSVLTLGNAPVPRLHRAEGSNGDDVSDTINRFELLVQRNIFLREQRLQPRPDITKPENKTARQTQDATNDDVPADPAFHFVLKGVTLQGQERTAFIEDQRGDETHRVTISDALAGGELVEIELDYIMIRFADSIRRIALGHRLTGEPLRRAGEVVSTGGTARNNENGEVPSPDALSADAAQDATADRMRQRRQQELQGESSGRRTTD